MKTNILFFLSLFLAFTKASAQDANADLTNRMNYLLEYVNRSEVGTDNA
jgi:hypothetical protein